MVLGTDERGRDHGDLTLEKPRSSGGADGQGGMSVPLANGRLLPASGRWGAQGPQGGNRAHTRRLHPHPGRLEHLRQTTAQLGPGSLEDGVQATVLTAAGGATRHSSVEGAGAGIVDIRRLPSRINRNSLSRSFWACLLGRSWCSWCLRPRGRRVGGAPGVWSLRGLGGPLLRPLTSCPLRKGAHVQCSGPPGPSVWLPESTALPVR